MPGRQCVSLKGPGLARSVLTCRTPAGGSTSPSRLLPCFPSCRNSPGLILLKAEPLKDPALTAATRFWTVAGARLPYRPGAGGTGCAW